MVEYNLAMVGTGVRFPSSAPLTNLFELFGHWYIGINRKVVFLLLQRNHPKGRMVFIINIIKQEIKMEESLKQKLEFICPFCKTKPTFINSSIRKIDKSNLNFIEPHRVIIKGITFLVFNYSTDIYIRNLANKIKISELENYLNTIN